MTNIHKENISEASITRLIEAHLNPSFFKPAVFHSAGALLARHVAIRCLVLALALASPALAAPGSAPPSPAALNIKPIYEGLWLPTSYAPGNYRCDSGSVSVNSANPPRKKDYNQSFLCEVPFPSHGGNIDPGSNVDDWKRINLSSMTLYATAQNAHDAMAYKAYGSPYSRKVGLGNEALFRPWKESFWPKPAGYGSKLYDKDHEWDRRSTDGIVRVGRVVFDISISGALMIDRVDADTGKGFKSFQGFITIAEAPTRAELEQDLSRFTSAIESYAGAMGWLTDLPVGAATSRKPSGTTQPQPAAGKPSAAQPGSVKAEDNSSSTGNDRDRQSDPWPPLTPGAAAGAAAGAGLLAAIGSLLFTRTMGVSFSDLADIFSNTSSTPPPQPEPPRILFQEPPHQNGDVNDNGEVWDASLPGWVGRNLYEQDRQRQIDLAAKDVADRVASRSQDADVKELHDETIDSRDKLQEIRKAGLKQEADWARGDLEQLFNKEMQKGPIAPERAVLFANIWNKIQDAQESDDYAGGLDDLQKIGNLVQGQGRATYEPTYTVRDFAEDAAMRVGATVLDLGGGGGYANAAISFMQGARECVRHGADSATALMEGSKNALLEIATFKVGAVGERLGFDPLKVIAAATGATRGSITFRDALEQGDSLVKAATKGVLDGTVNAAATYGIGKVMEQPSAKLSDVVWGPKPAAPVIGAPEDPHIAQQLANAKRNISVGSDGKKYMDLDDALRLQQQTTVMRTVKQGLADPEAADALKNTLNGLKQTHDGVLVDKIKAAYPELGGKEVRVGDFSTPGNKDPNPFSVDRDARVLVKNDEGKWVELPKAKWKDLSQETFSEVTGHSQNPDRFRAGLSPAERARYDSMGKSEQLEFYQEKHQWKLTDKSHIEASRDYSDQKITATGEHTQVAREKIGINRVKRGEAAPEDAEGLGLMARAKISGEVRNSNPSEAFA